MYIHYDDAIRALVAAKGLVAAGRWHHKEDPLGRRHIYERQFDAGKDPGLSAQEVLAVFSATVDCVHERGSPHYFRTWCHVEAPDWTGVGRILFHVDSVAGGTEPGAVIIVSAFREWGWQPKPQPR